MRTEKSTGHGCARSSRAMQLVPIESPEQYRLVAGWLAQKENYQWLDFGDGRQLVSPEWLKIEAQRGTQVLRLFTSDDTNAPLDAVGLANINAHLKTANIWHVLGDKTCVGRCYASRAGSVMLTLGFS